MKNHGQIGSIFAVIFFLCIAVIVLGTKSMPVRANDQNILDENMSDVNSDGILLVWSNETVAPVLEDLADDFFVAYQIELVVEVVTDTQGAFFQSVPLGDGPDITFFSHESLAICVEDSLIAPIDIGALEPQFLDISLEASTINGQLYGLPWASENLGFFYNTDLVPIPPSTWNGVQTIGENLQTSGDVIYGMSLYAGSYNAYPLMTAFGGYVFGKDGDGNWDVNDLGIDSPGMIASVEWLVDRVDDGFLSNDTDWNTAHTLFETSQAPFIMTGPWALERIRASGIPYAIADFPNHTQSGIPFMGVQVFVISAQSTNIPMAETFLKEFVATEETMTALSVAANRPPVYLPAIGNITDPDMLAFEAISENAVPMPNVPEMGNVWSPWDNALNSAFQGIQTAEEALTVAAEEIRTTYLLEGMVNVPGDYQTLVGCSYDWQPSCMETAMTEVGNNLWASGPFVLPAGDYECKVALDGSWYINYGLDGVYGGPNIPFTLDQDRPVSFLWDEETKLLTIENSFVFLPIVRK